MKKFKNKVRSVVATRERFDSMRIIGARYPLPSEGPVRCEHWTGPIVLSADRNSRTSSLPAWRNVVVVVVVVDCKLQVPSWKECSRMWPSSIGNKFTIQHTVLLSLKDAPTLELPVVCGSL